MDSNSADKKGVPIIGCNNIAMQDVILLPKGII
jgi:hypothetical protein